VKNILPDLLLPSRSNKVWYYNGIDSLEHCADKVNFQNYPHKIDYRYNSRGFRDCEWPNSIDQLQQSIWCVGDSFTVGIGSKLDHTWVHQLEISTNRRVINISMDGASNDWICRRVEDIVKTVNPTNIVIMWSYLNRRESLFGTDEDRRLSQVHTANDNFDNFKKCLAKTSNLSLSTNIIHSTIPNAHDYSLHSLTKIWDDIRGTNWPTTVPSTIDDYNLLPAFIKNEIITTHKCWDKFESLLIYNQILNSVKNQIGEVMQLDFSRDGYHFDLLTSQWIVDRVMPLLNY
jgi:hypothetical protein